MEAPDVAPFIYREFYDFPRVLLVSVAGSSLLLDSPFDTELDDYRPEYAVYLLPNSFTPPDDWASMAKHAVRRLGALKVKAARFDETRRRAIEIAPLLQLLEQSA